MKHMLVVPRNKYGDKENSPVCGGKRNQCVIYPANVIMVADALGRRNQNCIVQTNVASDLIIQLGDFSFHLHKLPMVSRSAYLNRVIFQKRKSGDRVRIEIDNFPGGVESFEMVVKFCYGWKVELSASNVAPLYCAAHFLEMSDDLQHGNLIPKTEAFLSFLLLSSWKDCFQVLRSCEAISISPWANNLHVLRRCSEAIAWKACANPDPNWWLQDVSYLRIDHFISVVDSLKKKGMKPELVGSCIAHWTAKWISRMSCGVAESVTPKQLSFHLHTVTLECIIKLLPTDRNSVSCNLILHLLRVGLAMRVDKELLQMLERRAASMMEQCRVSDLLVNSHVDGDTDSTTYDVKVVNRVVRCYASSNNNNNNTTCGLLGVGKLLDGYLALVAGDDKLSIQDFQSLVEALPRDARQSHDNLYRAIDMYLKAHPSLTEEERHVICKAIENHKLSKEARDHAMHNDRLPLNMSARLVLMEQVNMARSMTASGSSFRRTRAQTVIRSVSRGLGRWMSPHNEISMMKREVETMKVQLNHLHMCKSKLQRQAKCFVR